MRTCYIICAGDADIISINKSDGDYIIAADAGFKHCERNNIEPDLITGDFDSLGFMPDKKNIVRLPVKKDDTDTFAAVKIGLKKGYSRFVLFGASGGARPEHTYANIAVLAYISKLGGTAFMDCGSYTVTAVTNGVISFPDYFKGDISVFSFDNESNGVCERGLEYSLEDAVMKNVTVTGISNSFTGKESSVSVKEGTLIIYYSGKPCGVSVSQFCK